MRPVAERNLNLAAGSRTSRADSNTNNRGAVSRLAPAPMDTAEGCGIRGAGVGLGSGLCALPFKKNYLPAARLKAAPGQRRTLGPAG